MNLMKYKFKDICNIIWMYKFPKYMLNLDKLIFSKLKMKDIIVIESHNDFDMNGGAFYNYLIDNGYNKKYKIIWLIKNKNRYETESNVRCVNLLGPSIIRDYYNCVAKYFFFDNTYLKKMRYEQKFVYLGHATRAMKNCRGLVKVSDDMDYIISSSEFNDDLMSDVYEISKSKFITTGFPVTDQLFNKYNELNKLELKYDINQKVVIWMPTFRKSSKEALRNDSSYGTETGLPLIKTIADYNELNSVLNNYNMKLIIKFHPAQDMNDIHVSNTDNIEILSPERVKELRIDTYKLLTQTDALISDYSSISFDYLLLDRPIAYVLSDYEDYKLGFAVDNPKEYMPGEYIYKIEDFKKFLDCVNNGNDIYRKQRNELKDKIHKYQDGKSSGRITEILKL